MPSFRRPGRVLVLLLGAGLLAVTGPVAPERARLQAQSPDNGPLEARLLKDVTFLASDACEGRGVDTKGINLAADHIAEQFKQAGLMPAAVNGTYFQPFTVTGGAQLGKPCTLAFTGPDGKPIELALDKDFRPLGLSGSGRMTAGLVFAGYGAVAEDIHYDDFKGLDVAGKVVILIRKVPRSTDPKRPFDGDKSGYHSSLATKVANAEKQQAAAVLIVNDRDTAGQADPLIDFAYTARGAGAAKVPALSVLRSAVAPLIQDVFGKGLEDIEKAIDEDLTPRGGALKGWTATLETTVTRPVLPVKNIVGTLPGAGALADEVVVIGAHYDHLGFGGFGSLAKNLKEPMIHRGADDNGSGSTALMELARRFGAIKERQGRRLVFIAFSGEEMGLLGSEHYCKHPLFPMADTVAMVNLDMVGRLRPEEKTGKDKLIVYGTGTSRTFDGLIDHLNENYHFLLSKVPGGFGPSDHASFYQRKVPVFFFFTGDHPDYHRPTDTADKINIPGMVRVCGLVEDLTTHLATVVERPDYIEVKGGNGPSAFNGPRIGIRPEYGDDKEGVLLGGVSDGGPAAKAGLKAGDRIIEVLGKPVKNLEMYMSVLAGSKKGQPVMLGILRDGKKLEIEVVPE